MITLEKLREYGADTARALALCRGHEEFYLHLVRLEIRDEKFTLLGKAMDAGDAEEALRLCGELCITTGNLSLTPLLNRLTALSGALESGWETARQKVLYRDLAAALQALRAMDEAEE